MYTKSAQVWCFLREKSVGTGIAWKGRSKPYAYVVTKNLAHE